VSPTQHATDRLLGQTTTGFSDGHLSGTEFGDDDDIEGVDEETDGLPVNLVNEIPNAFPDAGLSPSMRGLPPPPGLRGCTDETVQTKTEANDFVDVTVADVTGAEERGVPSNEIDDAGVDCCDVGGEGDLVIVTRRGFFAVNPTETPPTQLALVKDLRVVLDGTFKIRPVIVIEREMFGVKRRKIFSHCGGVGTTRKIVVFVPASNVVC